MPLGEPTTRRSVVKTGAKLAYATPLVAATIRLGTHGAEATISADVVCPAGFWQTITVTVADADTGKPLDVDILAFEEDDPCVYCINTAPGRYVIHCVRPAG